MSQNKTQFFLFDDSLGQKKFEKETIICISQEKLHHEYIYYDASTTDTKI